MQYRVNRSGLRLQVGSNNNQQSSNIPSSSRFNRSSSVTVKECAKRLNKAYRIQIPNDFTQSRLLRARLKNRDGAGEDGGEGTCSAR